MGTAALDESMLVGIRRRRGARGDAQLRVDVADVSVDGSLAEHQPGRDGPVGVTRNQKAQDLELTRCEPVRPGGTVVYSVCTINADEAEAVVDASGLEVDPTLGDEWPVYRHRSRPEFLQTLPHAHGTAGFFVARLRVR